MLKDLWRLQSGTSAQNHGLKVFLDSGSQRVVPKLAFSTA